MNWGLFLAVCALCWFLATSKAVSRAGAWLGWLFYDLRVRCPRCLWSARSCEAGLSPCSLYPVSRWLYPKPPPTGISTFYGQRQQVSALPGRASVPPKSRWYRHGDHWCSTGLPCPKNRPDRDLVELYNDPEL